jgi:hypothetical protein
MLGSYTYNAYPFNSFRGLKVNGWIKGFQGAGKSTDMRCKTCCGNCVSGASLCVSNGPAAKL